ncbi:hypothetical protein [Caproicibacterium lactatifermentans]|uniref:Uncharacterized protein n=1 Tax=Caproicibacterium lactatifermentans TaxID=2666138 RepID=A0ABX6PVI8_9FIRM|nr:hypothetical protein [Caproicibacterium lactatifermentans]QKO30264.1 hypothetical protein GKP14_04090 [Caproicibacterium lactatifermentans]
MEKLKRLCSRNSARKYSKGIQSCFSAERQQNALCAAIKLVQRAFFSEKQGSAFDGTAEYSLDKVLLKQQEENQHRQQMFIEHSIIKERFCFISSSKYFVQLLQQTFLVPLFRRSQASSTAQRFSRSYRIATSACTAPYRAKKPFPQRISILYKKRFLPND